MRRALALPTLLAAILPASTLSAKGSPPGAGEEAATTIRVTIATDGKARDCTIVESGGSADLDKSACETMMRRARFRPAVDKQGHPMESTYTSRIRWRIQP